MSTTPQLRRAMLTPQQLVHAYNPSTSAIRTRAPATTATASRSITTTSRSRIGGYVALWDSLSGDLGGFREKIRQGAFARTLESARRGETDVLFFVEHDSRAILGRLAAGNLKLREDAYGLAFELTLPPTTLGRDTATLVASGILRGCSFSFSIVHEHWDKSAGRSIRELRDVRLFECSVVSTPAYSATSVSAIRGRPDTAYWTAARLRARVGRTHEAGLARAQQRSMAGGLQWR